MASKPKMTIKDIARVLGVSISTVSRALRDNPDISLKTRQMVKDYAQANHYKPNALAMNLRTSHSKTVGVIIPQFVHHFFSCVLSGIEKAAKKEGYILLVAQSNEDYEDEKRIIQSFETAQVCGVITSLAKNTKVYDHYTELIASDIPLVFYDRICPEINTERVVVDDYAGSFTAVEYLIQTGCKRIHFYSSNPKMEISKNRRNGYLDAMKRYHIPVEKDMMQICDTREQALAMTPNIIENSSQRPDAFFAVNDETASGILHVCKQMKINVPDEISICGFTDGAVAMSTDPKLTTVGQDGEEVGKAAFQLLLHRINSDEDPPQMKNHIVRTNLIVRGTTK